MARVHLLFDGPRSSPGVVAHDLRDLSEELIGYYSSPVLTRGGALKTVGLLIGDCVLEPASLLAGDEGCAHEDAVNERLQRNIVHLRDP